MPCFCSLQTQKLSTLMPKANLSVRAVPPQLAQLASLLGIANGPLASPSRADLRMNAKLPSMSSQAWLHSTLSAVRPGIPMVPNGGPPLMALTARVGAVSGSFPTMNPQALLMELKRTLKSMAVRLMPFNAAAARIPKPQMTNMVMAARLTLGLRAQGLCPMALSQVDMSFSQSQNLGNPTATLKAAIGANARLGATGVPPFALPLSKLNLAMSMAALAPLASLPATSGLPPVSDPNFTSMAMSMLSGLSSLPAMPIDPTALLNDLMRLSDLSAIEQAFGADAMTPAGVLRVQNMLNFVGRLNLPQVPPVALALQPKLDMLPSMDAVMAGAQVAKMNAPTFASALRFTPGLPPILPLLEAINAFRAVLADALGAPPAGACGTCKMVA